MADQAVLWRSPVVQLSGQEFYTADQLARMAVPLFPEKSWDDRTPAERLDHTRCSFLAELALHLRTGETWFAGLKKFTTPTDVGPYQVKASYGDDYHLIVRKNVPAVYPDTPFLFAVVAGRKVEFRGWCNGHEADDLGEFHERRGRRPAGWWVRQEYLHPMTTLFKGQVRAPKPRLDFVQTPALPHAYRGRAPEGDLEAFAKRVARDVLQPHAHWRLQPALRFQEWSRGFRTGMHVQDPHLGEGWIVQLAFDWEDGAQARVLFHDQRAEWVSLDEGLERLPDRPIPTLLTVGEDTPAPHEQPNENPRLLAQFPEFQPKARVVHDAYGTGTVVRLKAKKAGPQVVVDFDQVGRKCLNLERHRFTIIPPDSVPS